jgi:hypothetical protein
MKVDVYNIPCIFEADPTIETSLFYAVIMDVKKSIKDPNSPNYYIMPPLKHRPLDPLAQEFHDRYIAKYSYLLVKPGEKIGKFLSYT